MSRVLQPFEYLEPVTIDEAVDMLSRYGPGASVMAGGVGLVEAMRDRGNGPQWVISLQGIPALDFIKGDRLAGLRIGALTSIRSVELSSVIERDYPVFHEAAHQIASVQVKNMGTLVGNLCCGTPASDLAPPLLVLGAELKTTGPGSPQTIPLDDFFKDAGRTALGPDEIVAEISVPPIIGETRGAFLKLARVSADIAKVNAAITIEMAGHTCLEARIALGSVAPTPIRALKAEAILMDKTLTTDVILEAARAAAEEAHPIDDIRSTAGYRREMAMLLVKRVIQKALKGAVT